MTKPQATVLYDAPGPKARLRNNIYTMITVVALLGVAAFVVVKLNDKGQFAGNIWAPFFEWETWNQYLIPGVQGTLTAAVLASIFALIFGSVFGLARLSDHKWIRIPAGWVVEVFRAIPLLLLIFFIWFLAPDLMGGGDYGLLALVIGLTLYNGSVLAEVVRAGVLAVPKGQSEAAYAIGMRKSSVMRLILLPQALTAMMPAVVSQLVVLLKDTALGYIITYIDLLNMGFKILPSVHFGTKLVAAIFIGVFYIGLNMLLSWFANWLERRSRRSRKTAAKPVALTTEMT
ncbi:amino acid ABC transporter permease [Nonomuraea endophytica]|uniref:Glutamate transport system permease protein n=1 Tax=Nonomuraea endophytica TaxID=714136 RepID=A0A7W8A7T3_9ACTN|nr:amino acid ABC transporter permease [Nonomuraea endophytica]MBB5080330.1 glutamate transport system permease protein [Nonomuraea endophytica]